VPDDLQTGGYYAYVTVTGGQEGDATGANTAAIQGQLAVPFLITVNGDGELDRAVAIDRFAPVLQPDGRIGFAAAIRNTGNIHSSPTGSVTVTLENGEAYGSLDFVQSTPLLPGAERLLTTQGTLPVQDGASYMATIEIGGTNIESATLDAAFTMDPPAVLLGGLTICENLDRGPSVTATVENPSTLGVMGMIDVSVQAADGSAAGQAMVEQPPVLWPGEATTLTTDIQERLVSGDYVLIVTLTPAIGEPITAELPFAIGGTGPTTAPICQAPATPDTNG
jgi:hypothetical protein